MLITGRDGGKHELDLSEVDEIDEKNDDQMLALVWCTTHGSWEWHWIPDPDYWQ
jgi:hypothetical protein